MARNVGAIELTVDADTGRLVAQLRQAGRTAGQAAARAIDAELADIGNSPQLRRALTQLRARIERAVSGIEATIGVHLDGTDLRRTIAELEALVEAADTDADIGATIDNSEVRTAIAGIEARVAAADADISIGADIDQSQVATALAGISAQVAALGTTLGGTGAGGAGGVFGTAGRGVGSAFASGFSASLSDPRVLAGVAAAIAAIAAPAAAGLEGLLGASVAVAGSAFSALGATAGAAIPALAGVGGIVATLIVGMEGLGDALSGDTEALRKLTPEARQFVEAMEGLGPILDRIRRSVQERLFQGLSDELTDLSTTAIPAIGEGLGGLADELNEFFVHLAKFAERVDWVDLFGGLEPVVDGMLRTLLYFSQTFVVFLDLATPAAERLADAFAYLAAHLRSALTFHPNAFQDFLDRGLDSLAEWAELIRSVGDALLTLFAAGQSAGDSFVSSLAGTIERFDTWMESVEGQQALADFFDRARQVMSDLAPVVEGLIGFFDRIITPQALDNFGRITDIIGDLLPVMGTLLDLIGTALTPWLTQWGLVVDVVALLAAAWEDLDPAARRGLILLTGIGAIVIPLIDGIEWLTRKVEDFADAIDIDPPGWLRVILPGLNLVDAGLEGVTAAAAGANATFDDFAGGDFALTVLSAARTLGDLADQSLRAREHQEALAVAVDNTAESLNAHQAALQLSADFADQARQALDALQTEMLEQVAGALNAEQAALNLANGYAALQTSSEAFTTGLADGTLKGREAETAMRDLRLEELALAEQAYASAEAFADEQIELGNTASKADLMKFALIGQKDQYPLLVEEIDTYIGELEDIPDDATTDVAVNGVDAAIADINRMVTKINAVDGQTIEIFGRFTPTGRQIFAQGGIAGSGLNIAGESGPEVLFGRLGLGLVASPTVIPPGTIVSPLTGSLSTVNPTVRALTAALREVLGGDEGRTPGKQTNIVQHFTLTEADPAAVAEQSINRAAAMANL